MNLTGNSASGSRGNNRQIDIRGMGPENTLILVDGVPVTSRNSVRYSWRGERDTRGDTNWVPPEMVERIEVIRGPAAARYGSGAAGGVVNIITRRPGNDWHGSLSLYTNQPENEKEGATRRTNFSLSGPLAGDALTMRLYGNLNKTDADDYDNNTRENGGKAAAESLEGNVTIPLIRDTLEWRTNATWMLTSESKKTGNPLSVIPEYTINTLLDWQVTDKFSAAANWTMYGRQKPRSTAEIRTEGSSLSGKEIGAYSVAGLNLNYDVRKNVRASAGISNLFDKRLYRENQGASTYNEPGRAWYAGMTLSF